VSDSQNYALRIARGVWDQRHLECNTNRSNVGNEGEIGGSTVLVTSTATGDLKYGGKGDKDLAPGFLYRAGLGVRLHSVQAQD
jgi:hypothetical protein